MSMTLWKSYNYSSPISCLVDQHIRVFDIRKANISVLREKGHITQEDYVSLFNAPKLEREVYIGKLVGSDPGIGEIIKNGILEAKRLFFDLNGLEDNDILEINNDAVYVIGNRPILHQQVSDYIYFNDAEIYTSFYRVKDIRYYYFCDRISGVEYLNPKGLGKAIALHEPYMLDFLKALFYTAQFEGIQNALNMLSNFYNMYISNKLDIGYYRNLNAASRYNIKNFDRYAIYQTEIVTANMINIVDRSYNERILREFNKLLSDVYFNKYR